MNRQADDITRGEQAEAANAWEIEIRRRVVDPGLIRSANGSAFARRLMARQEASELIRRPKASALTRPPSHGGYRAGSGRKPILDGGIKRTFVVTPAHLAMLDAWARRHNIDNRSAALRHLIESAISQEV